MMSYQNDLQQANVGSNRTFMELKLLYKRKKQKYIAKF